MWLASIAGAMVNLELVFLFAFFAVPPLLVIFLGPTRVHWLPGTALVAVALVIFATADAPPRPGEPAYTGIGRALQMAAGVILTAYGVACVLVARWLRGRSVRAPRVPSSPVDPPPIGR
jgi:hypothetical protein